MQESSGKGSIHLRPQLPHFVNFSLLSVRLQGKIQPTSLRFL
jgi:hypothetical protein